MRVVGDALNLIEPASGRVLGHVPLGPTAAGTSAGFDIVTSGHTAWVLVIANQRLVRVDLRTRRLDGSVRLPWVPAGRLAIGGGLVWVTQDGGHDVLGVAARTARVARRFAIGGQLGTGIAIRRRLAVARRG